METITAKCQAPCGGLAIDPKQTHCLFCGAPLSAWDYALEQMNKKFMADKEREKTEAGEKGA